MSKTKAMSVSKKFALLFVGILIGARVGRTQAALKDRIVQPINDAQISVVHRSVRPWARSENDRGKVDDSFMLDHISMVFKPSENQQNSLANLLQQLQDPSSTNYHKWLSPDQFGSQFGLSQNDLNQVVSWLENQGFVVDEVARSHMWVVFSGTAGQVNQAFHAEIHHYLVGGKLYYANSGDPEVPSAIASVVLGFRGFDNFRPKPRAVIRRVTPAAAPRFTSSISGDHFLSPNDFATIYDVNALYHSGVNGEGQSIAVMGQTDIYTNDLTAFRAASGLAANNPTIIVIPGSPDPGVSTTDLPEADLDLEWSGAIAPNATIIYVNSGTASGAFDSLQYAIDQGLAPVVSTSYGDCEPNWSSSELATLGQMAEQANAEGITIIAPSGDNGATDCDYAATPNSVVSVATHGLAVDTPASLPYVTGVGGSEFNEGSGTYWSSSNNSSNGSALSYIPEMAWNDSSSTVGLAASGGGASAVFSKPSWQTGAGVPNDSARDVPDIAFNSSPLHDGYLTCSDGSCVSGFRESNQDLDVVGGTSAGAPIFAAILALLNQQTSSAGQGNVNYVLYPLAAQQLGAFHDITTGNNQEPCQKGTKDCPNGGDIGYSAGAGYDQVTGLGSLDVTNFVNEWASVASTSAQQPQNFGLSITPGSLSIGGGQSGAATVKITAINGFNGTVTFSCAVASTLTGATCAASPTSVTAGSAAPVTITVTLPASGMTLLTSGSFRKPPALGPVLALILGCGIIVCALYRFWARSAAVRPSILRYAGPKPEVTATRRHRTSSCAGLKTSATSALALLMLCLMAASLSLSCGGGGGGSTPGSTTTPSSPSGSNPGTSSLQVAPTSSIITVTGSATANGATISHSVLLSVAVQ